MTHMNTKPHFVAIIALLVSLPLVSQAADTPKEAVGFFGTATGVVKSAKADGTSFVLTVTKAVVDEKRSTVKDASKLAGKEITLGTRMPRKDNKPTPHEDDIAYIKTLKPGMNISIKVFAVRSDPSVLRMEGPCEKAEASPGEKPKP